MSPPRASAGNSLRFSNSSRLASTILLVALSLFGRTARGFVSRTPVVAAGASTGASETQRKYGGGIAATKLAGRVIAARENTGHVLTKVSMVGGNDGNRSVEEEWPFHKSRYASCVSYGRCSDSKKGPYLAMTLSSKRSFGQQVSRKVLWVMLPRCGRSVRRLPEASSGPFLLDMRAGSPRCASIPAIIGLFMRSRILSGNVCESGCCPLGSVIVWPTLRFKRVSVVPGNDSGRIQ